MPKDDKYEYVKATIREGCNLSWRYKIPDSPVHGSDAYDDTVEGYTDQEIIDLTASYLGVANPECIEVIWD